MGKSILHHISIVVTEDSIYQSSYIPHPMIVSQIWALLGFYKAAHFRADWPYVIPIHVSLYILHMLQEHFDIYDKSAFGKDCKVTNANKLKTKTA